MAGSEWVWGVGVGWLQPEESGTQVGSKCASNELNCGGCVQDSRGCVYASDFGGN